MEDNLTQLIQWVEGASEVTQEAREFAERDRDYYDNKQLTTEEKNELAKRGQPEVISNRIKRKIDFLTGIEKQQRTDPKAFPRNPGDEEAASAASDSLRFVEEKTKFDSIASSVWENMLIEGFGGCEIGIRFKGDEPDIFIRHVAWDRLFYDPYSSRKDFSDARYMGGEQWYDYDDLVHKYPNKKEIIDQSMDTASTADTYDDKPKHSVWADGKRKRVRVATIWYKKGSDWYWNVFTKGGELKGDKSPYRTQDGESLRGIVMRSAYVDRDNNRYGVVREMISPQDEVNKRRSKSLHLLNMRQVVTDASSFKDTRKVKAELAKPDGVVLMDNPQGKFEILNNNDQISGHFNLLQEAKSEIDLMGPNASMTGKSDKSAESGRAIQAQQQGGLIELATLLDGYRLFKQEVYETIWHLIRQYWTAEKWVRVTDQENNVKFVGLNQPIPIGEVKGYPAEMIEADPMLQQPSGQIKNDVAKIDVDILVEEAPDSVTIQAEQFEMIVRLVESGLQIPQDILIEMSQLRNKQTILDRMKGADDPEAQAAQQQQQQIEQAAVELDLEQKSKDIEKTDAEIRKLNADAAETEVEILAPNPRDYQADAGQRAR